MIGFGEFRGGSREMGIWEEFRVVEWRMFFGGGGIWSLRRDKWKLLR